MTKVIMMTKMSKPEINIFSENIHKSLKIDEKKAIETARELLNIYLNEKTIFEKSCLFKQDFNCVSFDILYCDNEKTHQINKEYRQKDYPADIITFAIFADSEEKFVFDKEINLGEIIISLDKVVKKGIKRCKDAKMRRGVEEEPRIHTSTPLIFSACSPEEELYFIIAHGIMHLLGFDHQTNEDYNFIVDAQNTALKKVRDGGK